MMRFVPGLLFFAVLLLAGCVSPVPDTPAPLTPAEVAPAAPAPVPASPAPASRPAPAPESSPVSAVPVPPPPHSPAPVPAPALVPAPAPTSAAKPASITGSEESSIMFDNFTVYVAAVDGRPISAGREGWNTPVVLPAGAHRLTVEFNRGVFAGRAELQLTAVSGAAYRVGFTTDAEIFGKNSYCEFWIVETGSDTPVTARARAALTRVAPEK